MLQELIDFLYVTIHPEDVQSNISFKKDVLAEICAYNIELCVTIIHMRILYKLLCYEDLAEDFD